MIAAKGSRSVFTTKLNVANGKGIFHCSICNFSKTGIVQIAITPSRITLNESISDRTKSGYIKKSGIYPLDPSAMDKEVGPSTVFQEITNIELEVEGNFTEGGLEGDSLNSEDDWRTAKDDSYQPKLMMKKFQEARRFSTLKSYTGRFL